MKLILLMSMTILLSSCGEKAPEPTSGRQGHTQSANYEERGGWFRYSNQTSECIGRIGAQWVQCQWRQQ